MDTPPTWPRARMFRIQSPSGTPIARVAHDTHDRNTTGIDPETQAKEWVRYRGIYVGDPRGGAGGLVGFPAGTEHRAAPTTWAPSTSHHAGHTPAPAAEPMSTPHTQHTAHAAPTTVPGHVIGSRRSAHPKAQSSAPLVASRGRHLPASRPAAPGSLGWPVSPGVRVRPRLPGSQ